MSYLAPGNGKTKQGYLWTAHAPGLDVVFHWETGRGAACLENIVPVNFRGVLQCDAYAAYPAFVGTREGIELVGCWAHARRHFHEAREHVPLRANWVLYQIQNLYRIEARLRESKAGPALRAAVRTSQSTMILNRLKRALENIGASQRHLPSSTFGKAINYTLSHWELLTKYVANGRIEPGSVAQEANQRLPEGRAKRGKSIRTVWKMRFDPRPSERRTGYFSETPKPDSAAP